MENGTPGGPGPEKIHGLAARFCSLLYVDIFSRADFNFKTLYDLASQSATEDKNRKNTSGKLNAGSPLCMMNMLTCINTLAQVWA